MSENKHLERLLVKAGLSEAAAALYIYLLENKGVSISKACLDLPYSRSVIYRAFERLKSINLVCVENTSHWAMTPVVKSLQPLIKKVKNNHRKDLRLLAGLRFYESKNEFLRYGINPGMEVLSEEETYQRYEDLSLMDWSSILCYGNWEGLNNEERNMVPLEKRFIQNRMKKGGKAFVVVTNSGPHTREIVGENIDQQEERKTKRVQDQLKPFWLNVFEGNHYVHLWHQDENKELFSTFIESESLSDFYKQQFYSKI